MNAVFFLSTIFASAHNHGSHQDCAFDSDFCGNNAVSEPIRSCTEGFYYDDAQRCCVMEAVYEPLRRCPSGGEPMPDGTCICESHPRISCPDGFSYDKYEHSCVYTELSPMIPSCAHRPDLAGSLSEDGRQCIYFKEFPPKMKCPKGSKFRDGLCIAFETLPAEHLLFTCPDGWEFDQYTNECSIVERVDCHRVKTKKSKCKKHKAKDCDFETFLPCEPECTLPDEPRRLCDNCKDKIKPELLCQATSCNMAVKEWAPKERSFVEPVLCERVTTMPAKPTCAQGSYNHAKNGCCVETVFPAEEVCTGTHLGNGCAKKMHYLADYVCPAPYEVSCGHKKEKHHKKEKKHNKVAHPSNCECVAMSFSDTVPYCPEGSMHDAVNGMCVQIVSSDLYCAEPDARLVDGLCHRVIHEPARLEYTVTYVTEEPCELDQCIEKKVPIKKRKVSHKEVHIKHGKAHTKCHDQPCVNVHGEPVHEPIPMEPLPPAPIAVGPPPTYIPAPMEPVAPLPPLEPLPSLPTPQ